MNVHVGVEPSGDTGPAFLLKVWVGDAQVSFALGLWGEVAEARIDAMLHASGYLGRLFTLAPSAPRGPEVAAWSVIPTLEVSW